MSSSLNHASTKGTLQTSLASALALGVLLSLGLLVGAGCVGTDPLPEHDVCYYACEHQNECLGLTLDCSVPEEHGTCVGESIECNANCLSSADCETLLDSQSKTPKEDNTFIACNKACPKDE